MRGLAVLLAVPLAAAAAAGELRLEVDSPLPVAGLSARVLGPAGQLAAMLRAGESTPVEAGTYKVELLTDPPLVRSAVKVPREGAITLRFTELGAVRLLVEDADGRRPGTVADLYLPDGRKIATLGNGEARAFPAGAYRAIVRSSPNRRFDRVRVRAGQIEELAVRLGAALKLEARLPSGAPADVHARVRHPDGSLLAIAVGETLSLPPGDYEVALDTVPPTRRSVKLASGATQVVAVKDLGALRFDLRGADGVPLDCPVTVLDPASGLVLARARNGSELGLLPGRYRVRFETAPPLLRERVAVTAGKTTAVGRGGAAGKR